MTRAKTYTPKKNEIDHRWYIVDADGKVLGRLASTVATVIRGKHKAIFTPNLDTGDHVVVVNASKVILTGDKLSSKKYYRHSGYPGGIKERSAGELMERDPSKVVERAVKGMLPKNRLGRKLAGKLHVYPGPEHPHAAQKPQPLEIDN
jgi:large subunit ribosomal protein L13